MALDAHALEKIARFAGESCFLAEGAVLTDLDGTAVHEFEGRIAIPHSVSHGLKRLYDRGRPVILNTLRFPINVIETFGREWYSITEKPLPLVSLNGAIVGYLIETADGDIAFEEMVAFPLARREIDELLEGLSGMLQGGLDKLLVFYYPRDWTFGEVIWTPARGRVRHVRKKYASASEVFSGSVGLLRDRLMAQEVCMIFVLIEARGDRLMAYQHAQPSRFVTRRGVDKLFGAREAAARLGLDLAHCVGAGDTPMDNFLKGVGLAVHVGPRALEFHGLSDTLRIASSAELGETLAELARLQDLAHA